jgi:hypothetical protein
MLVNSKFIIYNQVVMSIPNIIDKIKRKIHIDKVTIMYLFIIAGVGISSFCLGRLSLNANSNSKNDTVKIETNNQTDDEIPDVNISTQKMYLASKNGKMYYSIGCSGAKRIKLENQVWFSSRADAEKSGYTLSSACK